VSENVFFATPNGNFNGKMCFSDIPPGAIAGAHHFGDVEELERILKAEVRGHDIGAC